jgi:2-phospho-L-lactate guanylyltransferase
MSPPVVVPLDVEQPKTRLSPVLGPDERRAFALSMARDVLAAVRGAGLDPVVLATGPVPADLDAPVVRDDRPLTDAVDAAVSAAFDGPGTDGADPDDPGATDPAATGEAAGHRAPGSGLPGGSTGAVWDGAGVVLEAPIAVVMADVALATPEAVTRLVETPGDVVLVPGRGGGTNAFVARVSGFRVDYHGVSYRDHRRAAERVGASVGTVDSHRLSTDVDEPADLVELLLHGEGTAADWLRDAGFEVVVDQREGRVRVARS